MPVENVQWNVTHWQPPIGPQGIQFEEESGTVSGPANAEQQLSLEAARKMQCPKEPRNGLSHTKRSQLVAGSVQVRPFRSQWQPKERELLCGCKADAGGDCVGKEAQERPVFAGGHLSRLRATGEESGSGNGGGRGDLVKWWNWN